MDELREALEVYNIKICTLCHGSIKRFLVANPEILGSGEYQMISPQPIAISCLKYLRQPRYGEQLKRTEKNSFVTTNGEDISGQTLLTYSVRFALEHLCDVDVDIALAEELERLLKSPNFGTYIQLRSLLVEGTSSAVVPH
jgi:hypothetical protein